MSVKKRGKIMLARWLIDFIDTEGWRKGTVTGERHVEKDKLLDAMETIGRQELIKQAKELERIGLIKVHWTDVYSSIKKIDISVDVMDELFRREGIQNPRDVIACQRKMTEAFREKAPKEWIRPYYEVLLKKLDNGKMLKESENAEFMNCLNEVVREKEAVWKNVFSDKVFGRPKIFKEKYETAVVKILKDYSPFADAEMTVDEILVEHGIQSYGQQLELKGSLQYVMSNGKKVDTKEKIFGDIINAQTLMASRVVSLDGVKQIMTIENKANYEEMKFDPEILYLYCHGFFSPKERRFLENLLDIAGKDVVWYHWGDMDLGGIRIYNFIKKNLFPQIQPYCMNEEIYEKVIRQGKGYELAANKIKSLKELEAGELEGLKQCMIRYGKGIEQEVFLGNIFQGEKENDEC